MTSSSASSRPPVATPAEAGVRATGRLPKLLQPLDTALAVAACAATALVVALVTVEVVARYVFSSSILIHKTICLWR